MPPAVREVAWKPTVLLELVLLVGGWVQGRRGMVDNPGRNRVVFRFASGPTLADATPMTGDPRQADRRGSLEKPVWEAVNKRRTNLQPRSYSA